MYYYLVESSHWSNTMEFKSKIQMKEGDYFRILSHDGSRNYPTRFKILSVSETPKYSGRLVEIQTVDRNVEPF